MPLVTDRLGEARCQWCNTLLAKATPGSVVEGPCRNSRCKMWVSVEVKMNTYASA